MSGPKYSRINLNELNNRLVSINVDIQSLYSQINSIISSQETKSLLNCSPFNPKKSLPDKYEKVKSEIYDLLRRLSCPFTSRQTYGVPQINAKLSKASATKERYIQLKNSVNERLRKLEKLQEEINRGLSTIIEGKNKETKSQKSCLDNKLAQLPSDYKEHVDRDKQTEIGNTYNQLMHNIDSIPSNSPYKQRQDNNCLKMLYETALQKQAAIYQAIELFGELIDITHKETVSKKMMNLNEIRNLDLKEETLEDILQKIPAEPMQQEEAEKKQNIEVYNLRQSIERYAADITAYSFIEYCRKAERIFESAAQETNTDKLYFYLQQIKQDYFEIDKKVAEDRSHREKLQGIKMSLLAFDKVHPPISLLLQQIEGLEKNKLIEAAKVSPLIEEAAKVIANLKQEMVKKEEQYLIKRCVYESLQALDYEPESDFETYVVSQHVPMIFSSKPTSPYKVMASFSPRGEMIARLIRTVGSEKEKKGVTQKQRIKDTEAMGAWCQIYHQMIADLKKKGMDTDIIQELPPAAEHLHIEVDKSKKPARRVTEKDRKFIAEIE